MKKAYVKPVFLAEEFVAAASVATCLYKPNSEVNSPLDLRYLMQKGEDNKLPSICTNNDGHNILSGELKGNNNVLLGDYATKEDSKVTLFDTSGTACDFVWLKPSSGVDQIQVWGDGNTTNGTNPGLVADHNQRKISNLFNWNGIQNFMQFFAGCNATDQNHGLDYNTFSFNS